MCIGNLYHVWQSTIPYQTEIYFFINSVLYFLKMGEKRGLSFGAMDVFEPEDKSFSKHILSQGTGSSTPNEGSTCRVYIIPVGKVKNVFEKKYFEHTHSMNECDSSNIKSLCSLLFVVP